MPLAEDLTSFLNVNEFATRGTYTPKGTVSGFLITGLLTQPDSELTVGYVGVEGARIRFLCRDVDLASPKSGDSLLLNAVTYTVQSFEHDGTGFVKLALKKP